MIRHILVQVSEEAIRTFSIKQNLLEILRIGLKEVGLLILEQAETIVLNIMDLLDLKEAQELIHLPRQ